MTKILVVEDNPDNMLLFTLLLKHEGMECVMAEDGAQALELARREKPDLILCDLQLPKIDGYQVARTLKHEPEFSTVPMIAVSSFAMVGDQQKAIQAGFDLYIPKPIDPPLFCNQIKSMLAQQD